MESRPTSGGAPEYGARLASELDVYRDCTEVHNLPPIFHYWSNRYLIPRLAEHGFHSPGQMFLRTLESQCANHPGETVRILSAGSGNCDLEIEIAVALRERNYKDFIVECVDINPAMLGRGAELARRSGVADHLEFLQADLNRWVAPCLYHAVMADQSLHHVLELEWLFGQIRNALHPDGVFVVSDMIGRNGHLRWPESLAIVREFWRALPPSCRLNRSSGRYEAMFENSDCSTETFEGIRAQDIVPQLERFFHYRFFLGFGNVIDPFVDRSFGPNFDPASAWDREFIDRVHRRDEEEMAAGRLQPTHMLAVLGTQADAAPAFGPFVPPRVHVRAAPASVPGAAPVPGPPEIDDAGGGLYEWGSWPHTVESQLKSVCRMVEDAETRLCIVEGKFEKAVARAQQVEADFQARTAWALELDSQRQASLLRAAEMEEQLAGRTSWALALGNELSGMTAWALKLDAELTARTAWARDLESQLAERTAHALNLGAELTDRTAHVHRLESELGERTAWALELDAELASRTALLRRLDAQLAERTAWALRLDAQLATGTAWAHELETQLAERTVWALQLDAQLADRTALTSQLNAALTARTVWAHRLETELAERTVWALQLDGECAEVTAWAHRLEAAFLDRKQVVQRLENEALVREAEQAQALARAGLRPREEQSGLGMRAWRRLTTSARRLIAMVAGLVGDSRQAGYPPDA